MRQPAKAMLTGNWRQSFHFRTTEEWKACFTRLGFTVRAWRGRWDTFANVLFVLTGRAGESG